jgi:hypothetical protein
MEPWRAGVILPHTHVTKMKARLILLGWDHGIN